MTQSEWLAADRQYVVNQAFAVFERQGGTVSPSMRRLYARYVRGEVSITDLMREVDARAEHAKAQAARVFQFS